MLLYFNFIVLLWWCTLEMILSFLFIEYNLRCTTWSHLFILKHNSLYHRNWGFQVRIGKLKLITIVEIFCKSCIQQFKSSRYYAYVCAGTPNASNMQKVYANFEIIILLWCTDWLDYVEYLSVYQHALQSKTLHFFTFSVILTTVSTWHQNMIYIIYFENFSHSALSCVNFFSWCTWAVWLIRITINTFYLSYWNTY